MDSFALSVVEKPNGARYVRFTGHSVAFVKPHQCLQWEAYTIDHNARGYWRGQERFARFCTAEESARLDLAVETEQARRRLAARGLHVHTAMGIRGWYVTINGKMVS